MGALDALCVEIPGQGQEIPRVAVDGNASFDASCDVHGQRRRQVEPSRFEAEFRVHEPEGTRARPSSCGGDLYNCSRSRIEKGKEHG